MKKKKFLYLYKGIFQIKLFKSQSFVYLSYEKVESLDFLVLVTAIISLPLFWKFKNLKI